MCVLIVYIYSSIFCQIHSLSKVENFIMQFHAVSVHGSGLDGLMYWKEKKECKTKVICFNFLLT